MCWLSTFLTKPSLETKIVVKDKLMDYNELLRKKQQEFTYNLSLLIQRIHFLGCRATMGEVYRTNDQQWLYFNGKTIKNGKIVDGDKKSWTMDSKHLDRLAVDINLFIPLDGKYELSWDSKYHKELGEYWVSLHPQNKYAVTLKDGTKTDLGHFEMDIN